MRDFEYHHNILADVIIGNSAASYRQQRIRFGAHSVLLTSLCKTLSYIRHAPGIG